MNKILFVFKSKEMNLLIKQRNALDPKMMTSFSRKVLKNSEEKFELNLVF